MSGCPQDGGSTIILHALIARTGMGASTYGDTHIFDKEYDDFLDVNCRNALYERFKWVKEVKSGRTKSLVHGVLPSDHSLLQYGTAGREFGSNLPWSQESQQPTLQASYAGHLPGDIEWALGLT